MSNRLWDIEQTAFRKALRELRTGKKLLQQDISAQLGKPQSYVSKYETGERKLSYLEVLDILDVCEHSVAEFHALYLDKIAEQAGHYRYTRKKRRSAKH